MKKATPHSRVRLGIDINRADRCALRLAASRANQPVSVYVWNAVNDRMRREAGEAVPAWLGRDQVLEELWNNPQDAIYDRSSI